MRIHFFWLKIAQMTYMSETNNRPGILRGINPLTGILANKKVKYKVTSFGNVVTIVLDRVTSKYLT
jgi:hypothetical protein